MTRLFSFILNVLSQRRHTQASINQRHNAEDAKAELRLLQTALNQIHIEAEADRALKNEELRLERQRLRIERVTLVFVIVGVAGAVINLFYLKASVDAMYSNTQIQQRAYVNVHNVEPVAFEVGSHPKR